MPLFLVFCMKHPCGRQETQHNRAEHEKLNFVKAKHEILTNHIEHMIDDMELIPTDIIPPINKAWVNSFSEV